jgi:alpha-beta hydrolase superfamily lysophospholipase
MWITTPCLAITIALLAGASRAAASTTESISIRGQTITLTIYLAESTGKGQQRAAPRGTIFMGSGDVGWVGLAVSMAEELSAQGYTVAGINARQYLSKFTSGKEHLQPADVQADYRAIADRLKALGLLTRPVIVSGVSEGAALAVLAASDPRNHAWIDGVITMGLPATAELAWRWTDVGSWITKRDADEPSFRVTDFLAAVAPVPIWMIQSKKDEYVPVADQERFRTVAKEPKRQILIDASNHRFTDRRAELSAAYKAGLDWIAQLAAKPIAK